MFTVEGVEFPITQGNNIHFIDLSLLSFLWSSDLYYSWQTSESLREHLGQRKPWKQPVSPAALTSLHCPVFLFSGSVCCTGRASGLREAGRTAAVEGTAYGKAWRPEGV